MEKIEWTEDLSVGIGEIDAQHREFIRLVGGLPVEVREGYDAKKAAGLISFLENYADNHFRTEEMYMSAYSYPAKESHTAVHDKFRQEIAMMKAKAEQKADLKIILDINRRIYEWFVGHIKTVDVKLGEFLKGKMR